MRASGHWAALRGYTDPVFLRGGRMTKWKGRTASCAPGFGQLAVSVSYVALAAGIAVGGLSLMAGAAFAGSCTALPASVCSGAASGTGNDAQITFNLPSGANTITTSAGFGNDARNTVASPATAGLRVNTSAGSLTFTDANGALLAGANDGMVVNNNA
ncbi:MAG: hypothetical protein ORN49_00275, partial [Rhodobacteraceae bacterium]|nr:hypothetical protein [Paracoccaceae bacterium]